MRRGPWPKIGEKSRRNTRDEGGLSDFNYRATARIYRVRIATDEDAREEQILVDQARKRRSVQDRVTALYRHWCWKNQREIWSERSLFGFAGSLRASKLLASTVDTYITWLASAERERHWSPAKIALTEIRRQTRLARSEHRGKHAKDFASFEDALRAAMALRGINRTAALAMMLLGPRRKDLTRMCREDIVFLDTHGEKGKIVYDVRVSKGIRVAGKKKRITLSKRELDPFPPEIIDEVRKAFIKRRPFQYARCFKVRERLYTSFIQTKLRASKN
jgi:hypothetical protein